MGYDMHVEAPDDFDIEERDRLGQLFHEAVKARDAFERGSAEADDAQEKVHAAYEAMSKADKTYFRLNVWGMGRCREFMDRLGMLITEYSDKHWPEEPEGFRDEAYELWDEGRLSALTSEERRYLEECDAHKTWSVPDAPGIPMHKLCSNDGWLVTPLEIEGALSYYRSADLLDVAEIRAATEYESSDGCWWDEWIEFLEYSSKHGGFRVY